MAVRHPAQGAVSKQHKSLALVDLACCTVMIVHPLRPVGIASGCVVNEIARKNDDEGARLDNHKVSGHVFHGTGLRVRKGAAPEDLWKTAWGEAGFWCAILRTMGTWTAETRRSRTVALGRGIARSGYEQRGCSGDGVAEGAEFFESCNSRLRTLGENCKRIRRMKRIRSSLPVVPVSRNL